MRALARSEGKLPDQLQKGLSVVFVGTAAGRLSAAVGAYYAHPGNRFWPILHETGLTPKQFEPHEFQDLLDLGIGLTDLSKLAAGMDHEIAPDQYDPVSFENKIRRFAPRAIAFTSKKAASLWLGIKPSRIEYGRQEKGSTNFPAVFVLPSPSGAATRYWDPKPWHDLAGWLRRTKRRNPGSAPS